MCKLLLLLLLVMLGFPAGRTLAEAPPGNAPNARLVYWIPVHETIESGLEAFLNRAIDDAEKASAQWIVLDINTLGGRVDSAEGIGERIRSSKIPTVAFVHGKAASAGSYIALNAGKIVMAPGSTIGAAAVVDPAGREIDNPKVVSHWASEMRSAAEMRGRNGLIAEGMVDKNLTVAMPEIGRTAEKGEIVSLTAEEAVKVGYAEAIAGDREGVLAYLNAGDSRVIDFQPSPAERLARILTNPAVMTILLLVGIAGVAIELFVPGFGVPGILGIAAFALYFFAHYAAGFAGLEDIVLFVAGIALMFVEVFVPGFGIFGAIGIVCLISGVLMAAYDTGRALVSLGVAAAVAAVVTALFIKFFKHRGVWNRFILKDEQKQELGYVPSAPKASLLGKTGEAITPLRPAGTALFEGTRVDVVTSGEYIPAGSKVVVNKVEGTWVQVSLWKEEH
jgi:membrane-bound serine protease (ClpP class)